MDLSNGVGGVGVGVKRAASSYNHIRVKRQKFLMGIRHLTNQTQPPLTLNWLINLAEQDFPEISTKLFDILEHLNSLEARGEYDSVINATEIFINSSFIYQTYFDSAATPNPDQQNIAAIRGILKVRNRALHVLNRDNHQELFYIGVLYKKSGNNVKRDEYISRSSQAAQKVDKDSIKFSKIINMANICYVLGDYQDAAQYCYQAINCLRIQAAQESLKKIDYILKMSTALLITLGNHSSAYELVLRVFICCYKQIDLSPAADQIKKALARKQLFLVLVDMAKLYFSQKNYELTQVYLKEASDLYQKANDLYKKYGINSNINPSIITDVAKIFTECYYQLSMKALTDNKQSLYQQYYGELLKFCAETNQNPQDYQKSIAKHSYELGSKYLKKCDYPSALVLLGISRDIYAKLGDKKNIVNSLLLLAAVSYAKEEYAQAASEFETILPICEELGDQENIARVCGNLGKCYLYKDASDSTLEELNMAHHNFEQALAIYQRLRQDDNIKDMLLRIDEATEDINNFMA